MPLIDLHAHTHPLSHDSDLTPDELVEAAKAAGLDGVCLTEHDFFWDHHKAAELAQRHDFVVIPGIEVNTECGHVLVFGLEQFVYGMHRMAELAPMCKSAGAAMIAAHPYRRQLPFDLEREGDWSEALARAAENSSYSEVHAIETLNGRGTERQNTFSANICERYDLPRTAGSDAHTRSDVGACATEFEAKIEDISDIISALKSGRFRPVSLR